MMINEKDIRGLPSNILSQAYKVIEDKTSFKRLNVDKKVLSARLSQGYRIIYRVGSEVFRVMTHNDYDKLLRNTRISCI